MASSDNEVNILITEKALKYIQSRKLKEPLIVAILGSRSGGGGCEGDGGCGGGGGGCGGEGGGSENTPCLNVVLANGGNPGKGFVKVETPSGIPVYLSRAVFNRAKRSKNPLLVTVKGAIVKRLNLEGLDLTSPAGEEE